jgi:hypothetical protein
MNCPYPRLNCKLLNPHSLTSVEFGIAVGVSYKKNGILPQNNPIFLEIGLFDAAPQTNWFED